MNTDVQNIYKEMCAFGGLVEKEVRNLSQTWRRTGKSPSQQQAAVKVPVEDARLAENILLDDAYIANELVDVGKYLETLNRKNMDQNDKTIRHISGKIERTLK